MLDMNIEVDNRLNRIRLGDLYQAQLTLVKEQHPNWTVDKQRETAMQNTQTAIGMRIREANLAA